MGGERETFLEGEKSSGGAPAGTAGSVGQVSGARLRIHENQGQIHFHDDVANMKVAVPVSVWWKAWQELQQPGHHWEYVDIDNKTCLSIETKIIQTGDVLTIDSAITVRRLGIGTNYNDLAKFTKGGRK
jgi:hypothetical protein